MTSHLESVTMSDNTAWTWNVLPLLAVVLALGVVFFPQGNLPGSAAEAAAAQAMHNKADDEALPLASLLVPSPQPGLGEPELRAEDLPQSY